MPQIKKIIIALLIITIPLAAGTVYMMQSIQHPFGTAFIIFAVSAFGSLWLLLLITFLFYETRRKEMIIKMWLFVISLSVIYVIIDLASGYFLIEKHSPRNIPDKYRHHKLLPNTHLKFATREYNYTQRINSFGLRGRDIELRKPANHYRILMLGDSFTMGKGVEDDKTFSALLEKDLNDKFTRPDHKTIEVLNAGVVSYTPILSFFQLTKDLRPLAPDLVVLNLDMSDLVQEMAYRKMATYGGNGEIIGIDGYRDERPSAAKVRRWINRNLYITRLIFFYLERFSREITVQNVVTQADPELVKHTLADDTVQRAEQWQNVFDSILKIKRYCDNRGIKFLLTTYPWGHQVSKNEWKPGRFAFMPENAVISDKSIHVIEEFSMKNGIELLDLFPAFRSYNGTSLLYFSRDMHWTRTGHKVMADELKRFILATYLKN